MTNVAMFLFLGAAVVAVFAFCSIVVWVSVPLRERQARERLALLQALAENPGENALRVLEFLREEDARRAANRARQDRKGWIVGGLIMMAVGAGLGGMLLEIGDRHLILVKGRVAFSGTTAEFRQRAEQNLALLRA